MNEPRPSIRTAVQKTVKVPLIREEIPITELELLNMIQDVWPDRIPDDAVLLPDKNGPDGEEDAVVTVQWERDPQPGELEALRAARVAIETAHRLADDEMADEYDDLDDDDDDDDDDDEDDVEPSPTLRCRKCRMPDGSRHKKTCSLSTAVPSRVCRSDCHLTKASRKKRPR